MKEIIHLGKRKEGQNKLSEQERRKEHILGRRRGHLRGERR